MITKEDIEKYYTALPHGLVYSKRTGKQMIGKIDRYGYRVLCLSIDRKVKHIPLHRVIALCLIENPNQYPVINHIDSDKLNNRVTNLEWTTISANTQHAYDNGFAKSWNKGKKGCFLPESVLSNKNSQPNKREVKVYSDENLIGVYQSIRELCRILNFDRRTAMRVLNKKPNYNSINGFKLQYS